MKPKLDAKGIHLNKTGKEPALEKLEHYLSIAKRLAQIIQTNNNIKHTPSQIVSWAKQIRMLVEQNEVSTLRIRKALHWYDKHIGEAYVPVIESGTSLREKFIKLETAIARDNKSSKSHKQPGVSPEKIINSNSVYKHCYLPALKLLPESDNGIAVQLAQNIAETVEWYLSKQKRPMSLDLNTPGDREKHTKWKDIPDEKAFLAGYVEWLEEQEWIDNLSESAFKPSSKLLQRFRREYEEDVGFDVFTGKSI